MGVILQGILGGFSGKVGPVVGGKWKDVDYMRGYVIPSNPNTAGQQTQRAKFAAAVALARQILGSILQPYWDPFNSAMSGFNRWISENIGLLITGNKMNATAIMAKGTLTPTAILTHTYNTASGAVECTWLGTAVGNQTTSDLLVIVAYDNVNGALYSETTNYVRNVAGGDITIATGLTASNVIVYCFFIQGTGPNLIVSDSEGHVCVAP